MRIVHMLARFAKHPNLFVKFRDFIANESKKTWITHRVAFSTHSFLPVPDIVLHQSGVTWLCGAQNEGIEMSQWKIDSEEKPFGVCALQNWFFEYRKWFPATVWIQASASMAATLPWGAGQSIYDVAIFIAHTAPFLFRFFYCVCVPFNSCVFVVAPSSALRLHCVSPLINYRNAHKGIQNGHSDAHRMTRDQTKVAIISFLVTRFCFHSISTSNATLPVSRRIC